MGAILSVHEGPQSISKGGMAALETGMIVSNEPGYYKKGAYGIRIENLELVTESEKVPGGERELMAFETPSRSSPSTAASWCPSCCRRRSSPGSTPTTRASARRSARSWGRRIGRG